MTLLIILMCVAFEKYFRIGQLLQRFTWFRWYRKMINQLFSRFSVNLSGWLGLSIYLLPVVAVIAITLMVIEDNLFGFVGVVANFFILLYCLGPDDLYHQLREALAQGEEAEHYQQLLYEQVPHDVELESANALVDTVLILANERFFAVVFWFVIAGPVVCVIYRLTSLLRQAVESGDEKVAGIGPAVVILQQVMDWLPARISSLFYLVVGQFQPGFSQWLSLSASGLAHNGNILRQCGSAALGQHSDNLGASLNLVENALVVILVCIALLTLGAWVV